ncbi:phospholipase D3 [Olea europaea subsp. europaea]|uniref:Phospholipase D3 n=1 Tax=Olea europaea subsp. europaea TaxID=158383 RepID=A0A8S0TK90_OLEEU|nr:phospholipase D3 [Olea europaea subsp. europaea]
MRTTSSTLSVLLVAMVASGVALAAPGESATCRLGLAESMPDGLELTSLPGVRPTHEVLLEMIEASRQTLRIASFYLMLTPEQKKFANHPSTRAGRRVLEAIKAAGKRGVDIEIVVDSSNKRPMGNQEEIEQIRKFARVHKLDMRRTVGRGVQHSKFLVADNQTFYMGSSNFDWRSYAQVKEIGLTGKGCPTLAKDLDKIFRTLTLMVDRDEVPKEEVARIPAQVNMESPMEVQGLRMFMGASPALFFPRELTNRTDDIDGLLHVINSATKSIDISVMQYSPLQDIFGTGQRIYWPIIDEALRRAAIERKVRVRILLSDWTSTKPLDYVWARSLNSIQSSGLKGGGIHVKMFKVPSYDEFQRSVPYSRVKHDKYMVTDKSLYIGTSNWAPDYLECSGGVGVVMEPNGDPTGNGPEIVQTIRETFERDFNSQYANEL